MTWLQVASELDEFLEGAGAGTRLGEQLGTAGALIALPATLVALGALVYLVGVHDGDVAEANVIWRLERVCGALMIAGGLIGIYGASLVLGSNWPGELLGGTARGATLRLVGGIAMLIGFGGRISPEPGRVSGRGWAGVAGVVLGVAAASSAGHTVTEGNLVLHVVMNLTHLTAGAIWLGGLVSLTLVGRIRRKNPSAAPIAAQVVRLSGVATLAIVAVAAAGIGMSITIVDGPGDFLGTAWGRLLLVKVALVAAAVGIGAYNHFVVVPALENDAEDPVYVPRARSTIATEVVILLAVAVLTVFLTDTPIN